MKQLPTRPMPPARMGQFADDGSFSNSIIPAPDMMEWVHRTVLAEGGYLFNPDHSHLAEADLCFLWASAGFAKAGRYVLGQAEQVMFRAGGWQKQRQEQQMIEWFGRVPTFLITLAAEYCATCTDGEFCALVEHELYHIAQEKDEFGAPKFTKEGLPKLALRGHDVEEFVGVVRRYGPSREVSALIDATKRSPEVAQINVSRACGTCLLRAA